MSSVFHRIAEPFQLFALKFLSFFQSHAVFPRSVVGITNDMPDDDLAIRVYPVIVVALVAIPIPRVGVIEQLAGLFLLRRGQALKSGGDTLCHDFFLYKSSVSGDRLLPRLGIQFIAHTLLQGSHFSLPVGCLLSITNVLL
jgi:hypothetical protein